MPVTNNTTAYLQLTGAFALAGSSVVAGKLLAHRFPVFLVSALSLAVALILVIPFILISEKGMPKIPKQNIAIVFFQALVGMFLFRIFVLYGIKYTTALEGGIITSTTPAVVGILAFLILKEKLPFNKVSGIILTVLGILAANIALNPATKTGGSHPLLGNTLIFGAVIGEALFSVLSKKTTRKMTPLVQTALVSFFGLILFLPFAIVEALRFDFRAVTLQDWLVVFYYGAFITVIAYIFWFNGIAKVSAGTAAVFTGFMPISATILSCVILHEKLIANHLLSLVLVVMGIIMVSLPPLKLRFAPISGS